MQREIKFRGKNTINGNFVEGYYNVDKGHHFINAGHTLYPVHPWSIEQFTGLKDKNGIDIYEGDILRHPLATEPEHFGFTVNFKDFKWVCICVFENEIIVDFDTYFEQCEIIGNIHQNPELLNQ